MQTGLGADLSPKKEFDRMADPKTASPASPIPAGVVAPAFELDSSTGERIRLADFAGKRTVVLYFYPKADTPGCTKQACGFRDARAAYEKAGVTVLGISPDPIAKVMRFSAKYRLHFALLADPDHSVAQYYGVWGLKKFMGRKYMGVARTTFVIGKDGRVAHVFENVKPVGHDEVVLEWLSGAGQ
jgi:thioredoxin-dependent peroxiredoxin